MARNRHTSPTIVVKIEEAQREEAIRSNSGGCLIADAIRSAYPNLTYVTVDMATIRVTDANAGLRYTYLTPPSAQHLLLSFDQGWRTTPDTVTIKRAVQISPILNRKRTASEREVRRAELEAKEAAGTLTNSSDRRSLSQLRRQEEERLTRPTSRGPADVKVTEKGTVRYGGDPIPHGPALPNLLRGRDRHFGAKMSDPGIAFREAVEAEVAERLAQPPDTK